jgi:hypothetical protein
VTPACARAGDLFNDASSDFRADVYASPRAALRVVAHDVARALARLRLVQTRHVEVVIANDLEDAIAPRAARRASASPLESRQPPR